jgi:acylphosphatase
LRKFEFSLTLFIFLLVLSLPIYVGAANIGKEPLSMIPSSALPILEAQNNELAKVHRSIEDIFGSVESFYEYGTIYLQKDGSIVIGINKEDSKIKEFKEKIKSISSSNKVQWKKIDYSTSSLIKIAEKVQADLEKCKEEKSIAEQTTIVSVDEINGKVVLEVEEISEHIQKHFESQYGSTLIVKQGIAASPEISRERNWTKLGGGIALSDYGDPFGVCTSAGIGEKDSRYFLITAGHCLNGDKSGAYQYDVRVGTDHSVGNWNGIDVGLILLDSTNALSPRYVTNYFYWHAEDDSDYDKRIEGIGTYYYSGMYLCKSGNTTGVTCGYLESTSYKYVDYAGDPYGSQKLLKINNDNHTGILNFSSGGDSGAIVFDPYAFLIYGIHSGGESPDGSTNPTYGLFTKITDVMNLYSTPSASFSIYISDTNVRFD